MIKLSNESFNLQPNIFDWILFGSVRSKFRTTYQPVFL